MPNNQREDFVGLHVHSAQDFTTFTEFPPTQIAVGIVVAPTKADAVPALLDDMSVTFDLDSIYPMWVLDIHFDAQIENTVDAAITTVSIVVDGTTVFTRERGIPWNGFPRNYELGYQYPVSAGSHTVEIFWSVGSGISTAVSTRRRLEVQPAPYALWAA